MMSDKKRVCVAVTARSSYSRIRTALEALSGMPEVDLQVICSGSALLDRYGKVIDLIRADGFQVSEALFTFVEGNEPINMALTTANTITQTAVALRRLHPDLLVTIADRYETLGTAVAGSYTGVPLVHIQGGELSGNIDGKVRHAVTKLSDYHLVSNPAAAQRVAHMGGFPASIFVTGCPSIDLAREASHYPLEDVQRTIDRHGVGSGIDLKKDFIVLLQHPETDSHEQSHERMAMSLDAVARIGLPTLVFWPNIDAGSNATSKAILAFRESGKFSAVHYVKNLEGHEFLRLLQQSRCLVGNSSVGIREGAYLGVPVVNIGDRQFGRDRADNVLDCPWNARDIETAIGHQLQTGRYAPSLLYGDGHAGKEIARVIAGLRN